MGKRILNLSLTEPEINQVLNLLLDAESRGEYYGNKNHYWKRHNNIIKKIEKAVGKEVAVIEDTKKSVKVKFRWIKDKNGFQEILYCGKMIVGVVYKTLKAYRGMLNSSLKEVSIIERKTLKSVKYALIKSVISWFAKCGIAVEEEK